MTSRELFGNKGIGYLTGQWQKGAEFSSFLSDSRDFSASQDVPLEVFTPMVIGHLFFAPPRPPWLSSLLDSIMPLVKAGKPIHFFQRHELLPADVDCTAIGYSLAAKALRVDSKILEKVGETIAANTADNGIIQVYFDQKGKRNGLVDPVVCVNALFLLNIANQFRWESVENTERFVLEYLRSGQYVHGSRYYPSPETFLYFLSKLVSAFPIRYQGWTGVLIGCLRERQGMDSRPLELAQRILAATNIGLNASLDVWLLRRAQGIDGSFPPDAFFKYGRRARYFGGKSVTTAFAARALADFGRSLRCRRIAPNQVPSGNSSTVVKVLPRVIEASVRPSLPMASASPDLELPVLSQSWDSFVAVSTAFRVVDKSQGEVLPSTGGSTRTNVAPLKCRGFETAGEASHYYTERFNVLGLDRSTHVRVVEELVNHCCSKNAGVEVLGGASFVAHCLVALGHSTGRPEFERRAALFEASLTNGEARDRSVWSRMGLELNTLLENLAVSMCQVKFRSALRVTLAARGKRESSSKLHWSRPLSEYEAFRNHSSFFPPLLELWKLFAQATPEELTAAKEELLKIESHAVRLQFLACEMATFRKEPFRGHVNAVTVVASENACSLEEAYTVLFSQFVGEFGLLQKELQDVKNKTNADGPVCLYLSAIERCVTGDSSVLVSLGN